MRGCNVSGWKRGWTNKNKACKTNSNEKEHQKHQKKLNDGSYEIDWKACWINTHKGMVISMDEERGKMTIYNIGRVKFYYKKLKISYHKIH